jgi:phage gpG-like protein
MRAKDFINRIKAYERNKRTLPIIIGETAKNFFQDNFKKQGFDDNGVKRWQARKGQVSFNGLARVSKKSESGRAILVKTGDLRNSIRVKSASMRKIVIATDLDYSKIHNDGSNKMPQRQFIGESANLNKKIVELISTNIKNALLGK